MSKKVTMRGRLLTSRSYNMIRHMSWIVMGIGLLVALFGILGLLEGPIPHVPVLTDLYRGVASELVGIGITLTFVDALIRWNALVQEKRSLILRMGSGDNPTAVNAIRELDDRGWVMDGSLRKAYLYNADLEGTMLPFADLQEVHLVGSNLEWTDLFEANLAGALVSGTGLHGTGLKGACLLKADLSEADLQGARFVTLEQLRQTKSLRGATLVDGYKLPGDDTWRAAFETWCLTAKADSDGFLLP